MLLIYLALLLLGVFSFLLHYLAQWQIIRRLKRHYPEQWAIIQPTGQLVAWPVRWVRVTMVLKTTVPPLHVLLKDAVIGRWQRCWTYAPRIAWCSWLAALAMRWFAH
ncbi:hypothetical protein ACYJW8_14045 [Frateuria aurantia]